MNDRLFSDAEVDGVLEQLLPSDIQMLRRLDRENFLEDAGLKPEEKLSLQKLAGLLLAQQSSPGRAQQWIPSSNVKKLLKKWDSIGKPDEDAPPNESGNWIAS
jgi:hypothetical protein